MVKDREAWRAAVGGVTGGWARLSDWTTAVTWTRGWQWGWREGEGQKDLQAVGMSEVWKVMRTKEWTVLFREKNQPQTHTWIHLWERKVHVLIKNPKGYLTWARSILDVRKIPNNKGFTASCTILWTSIHSFAGTLPTRSNPLKLFVNSMHIPLLYTSSLGLEQHLRPSRSFCLP